MAGGPPSSRAVPSQAQLGAGPADGLIMRNFTITRVRGRFAVATATGLVCLLALGACGSKSSGSSDTTTPKNPQKAAATLLQKALQEEIAGNTAQAQTDFAEVVRLDPQNKYGFYNLGLIAQNAGKNADAANQYRLALTIDGSFAPALYNLGILQTAAGDTTGAIDLYRRAIAASPNTANAHFNLGLLLRKTGKTAEGNKEVQTAVKLDPTLASKAAAQGVPLPGK
jgi:Tfp pilus assembly protein PilF